MPKANMPELEDLHGLMAQYFNKRLKSGDELKPGELTACLSFLKSNHVSANIGEEKPLQNLLEAFKEIDYEFNSGELVRVEKTPTKPKPEEIEEAEFDITDELFDNLEDFEVKNDDEDEEEKPF